MADTGYTTVSPINGSGGTVASDQAVKPEDYWTLEQCKQAYLDYTGSKALEIEEIKEARRYRHHSQWTAAQIETFNKRKQPVVTYPRIGRKIDGIVGTVERLKQDPKAYPRTPQQEQGADLATAALRYALESQRWDAKTPIAADNCATDGHSGLELELIEGDKGDKEVSFEIVEDGFFYDPRSFRLDFSDARYLGVSKLVDVETAIEMMPDKEADIRAATETGGELSVNSDRENRWFTTIGRRKFIRLVDVWYKHKGGVCWTLFSGSSKFMEGQSPFFDEKNKPISKYIMFRCAVDQDGDSYGFPRALKSSQDEINQRRSKGLHILNTRRVQGEKGAFDDIEEARREAARPDGFVLRNRGFEAEFEDQSKQLELSGQLKFLEDAKAEIDNYGPSQVVTGEGVDGQSGRAIALRQSAALAELGPFILSYRGWKLRVYRAVFAAIQKYWTGERWVRVTDSEGLAQFIKINGTENSPLGPVAVNALGSVDVDIILDEGPDTINAMADTFETLKELGPSLIPLLAPPKAAAMADLIIETSPLPSEAKQKWRQAGQQQQPNPMQQQAAALQMQDAQAKVRKTNADAGLAEAKTKQTLIETHLKPAEAAHDATIDHLNLIHDGMNSQIDRSHDTMQTARDRHLQLVFKAADLDQAAQDRDAAERQAAQQQAVPA